MADFLFEIGLEEVPARMIAGAQAELERRVVAMLERERLLGAGAASESFSTPRRLAVLVHGVSARQEDLTEELLGPAAKIAYKDGAPGPAALAFAKKAGVEVTALRIVDTPKGEYVAATALRAGRAAAEVIAAELPRELLGIYWAKNMYWRAGKPERFVRPVRWLLALLDSQVVPVAFAGFSAGRETFGHRVLHGPAPLVLREPGDYVAALRDAFVMADVEARRHTIRKALDRVCRTIPEARWREDHALVDKMTHLTEWPSVIAGGFESEYLALPEEVLVTVMRDHQNYFAVEEQAEGNRLAPHFLTVLNTATDAAGEDVIRHGNERVLRARFNDARFFWEFDQRLPLTERVALLEKVTFQKDLGSYAAKTSNLVLLVEWLSTNSRSTVHVDKIALIEAARLAKTDLTTDLVKEFTDLQGILGGLYAASQGYTAKTSKAIYEQYRPGGADDRIPETIEGQLLSLADRIDTIAGMFSLGLQPTGSKDPFALRRAANGIVRILAEGGPDVELSQLSQRACGLNGSPGTTQQASTFLVERLEFYMREIKGFSYDVVKAVLAVESDNVKDAIGRAEAVTSVKGSEDFLALSAAVKRMKNILAQAGFHAMAQIQHQDMAGVVPAQRALLEYAHQLSLKLYGGHVDGYISSLRDLATLRPLIDAFFTNVMVMDPNIEVRLGRLRLLRSLVELLSKIADFSEIVVAG